MWYKINSHDTVYAMLTCPAFGKQYRHFRALGIEVSVCIYPKYSRTLFRGARAIAKQVELCPACH